MIVNWIAFMLDISMNWSTDEDYMICIELKCQ